MKKYGDGADSFHDQGTRVEASKRWHEQHQLRHDYSYRSPSIPKSRNYNKSTSKSNYSNKSTYKPNSNKSSYEPNYSKPYYKPNYSKKPSQHR